MIAAPLVVGLFCMVILGKNKKFSISWMFVFMWTTCLSFCCLGLYGLNKPSLVVVLLSCISMLIFTLVTFIRLPVLTFGKTISVQQEMGYFEFRAPTGKLILYVLNIMAYAFSIPYLKKSLSILFSKGLYFLREAAFSGSGGIGSTAVLMLFQYIVSPLFLATIIVTAIDIFDRRVRPMAIVISVLDVILYTVLFAGRFTLLNFVVIILFVAIDTGRIKSVWGLIVKHKKIVFFVGLFVIGLIVLTSLRSTNTVFKSVYVYFAGSFAYLSYLIDNSIGTNLYLCGRIFFGFLYNSVYTFLTVFFNVDYNGSNNIITQLTQHMVPIGGGNYYNSLGTMLHDFMADFGVYGSLVGVFLYAIICNYIEKLTTIKNTYFIRALYYYLVLSIVFSVLSYQFRGPGALFYIAFLYLFCHQKREHV